ncbi:CPBP family intramembrane metalloprotease [Natronosporangium hydrolyticum]|uniref:CPBP family intramembrane metalloprotease n=1 Tax=Natronosporangium hydrolyticum TaxID=2811111 RepID=A0A895YEQ1_9ACTN|nr:CPBP family intramembrane glutamic endopeptidase [Natronosporangium hydrolyticum]QSB12700.1 CPBP family intramembrane metalloprotease [Natronosporangium hydrolyticum]
MTGSAWGFAAVASVAAASWLAVYRLPLARRRTRQRFRLAVSSLTGLDPRYVFPVVGTAIYLVAGLLAITAVTWWSGLDLWAVVSWRPTLVEVALTALVALGAAASTGFAMSLVYAVRPQVDVPGAVAGVGWIREILVLPAHWRWVVPMSSAAVEEFFFRGVFLLGLLASGASVPMAVLLSGAVFILGQVVLTERGLAALVLGVSSVVLSVLCGLLVVVTGSVLPAIVVHASFAGFYTNLGTGRPVRTA